MNWIGHPDYQLPKGTLSLVGLNDGFDYIFLSTGFKGSSKNWWLSQQLLHPLTDRMDFRQEARVS